MISALRRRDGLRVTLAAVVSMALSGCSRNRTASPEVRRVPLRLDNWRGIDPARDDPALVALAGRHLTPRFENVGVSSSLHYAYLWGESLTMFGVSLDQFLDNTLAGVYSGSDRSLFYQDSAGGVRTAGRPSGLSEAHTDQVLAMLGVLGVESSRALGPGVSVAQGIVSLADRFGDHPEFEWSSLALLHYMPEVSQWQNRWGQMMSADRLVRRLVHGGFGAGSCQGTHRLQLATAMLRCDERFSTLSHRGRNLLNVFVSRAAVRLRHNQHQDGGWGEDWSRPPSSDPPRKSNLLVTGHHLEWLGMIHQPDVLPPQRWERAIAYCRGALIEAMRDDRGDRLRLCPLTHALKTVLQYRRNVPGRTVT